MASQITDLEKFTLSVTELNAAGAQVAIGGVPAWASSNEGVAGLSVAPDGLSAVVASGVVGVATVTVSVDGLSTSWDVTVVASPGVQLVLTASAPEPK